MASSLSALFLAGGLGGAVAFLLGLAFARTAARVIALGAIGAVLACAWQAAVASDELATTAGVANALGWLAGTILVARVRALEYLHAQEAA